MDISAFDYDLPEHAIGQTPAEPRDAARLLVDRDGVIAHHTVADLPSLLQPGDLVVVNDTRVLPARFHLRKATGGAVEVLLLEPTGNHHEWRALVRPGKRLHPGTLLFPASRQDPDDSTSRDVPLAASRQDPDVTEPIIEVVDALPDGRRVVRLLADDLLETTGEVPLPPYITEPLADPERYQTVYADQPGSVAAPTAGLHLTDEVLAGLAARDIDVARVELRVGLGTFRPIATDDVLDHDMHHESYRVEASVWDQIQRARADGRRIVAVGTTTVRTLESVAASGQLTGETSLFIHRGFDWKIVDVLLTNFHVPRSSLLVMIDALVGDRWRTIYETALDQGYRFLSFGDAMLLERSAR